MRWRRTSDDSGIGNRESGIGNRESGIGNRESVRPDASCGQALGASALSCRGSRALTPRFSSAKKRTACGALFHASTFLSPDE
ncbi:hypothetical protein CAI18_10580 [Xanthomonas citri pv. punicae]|nr:hypothetical protein CAI14_10605 [Xanthomonas citri pv. punicae]QCZ68677.1 hypothetical protein CAI17_08235 [Xanthomonas citri pv. punicae]QCZ85456.1 hypothetical protein CAI18_10580 [Xanthomonas citri pv. punicae]